HFLWSGGAGSISLTSWSTQLSTIFSRESVSLKVTQSFGFLLSSFAKQPLVGSEPPSNLSFALSSQSAKFGSGGLPGVSAFCSHVRSELPFFGTPLSLLTRPLLCGPAAASVAAAASSTRTP